MFFCLGLALIVDGIDGPLAREFKVAEVLPRWSGETLDLVVDFTTYVFVPAYAIAASGLLPKALAIPAGVRGRHHRRALFRRPADEDRRQLFSRLSGAVESGRLLSLFARAAAMARRGGGRCAGRADVLRRSSFVHPLRVRRLRVLNIALLVVWAVLALLAVARQSRSGALCDMAAGRDRGLFFRRRPVAQAGLIVLVSSGIIREFSMPRPVLLIAGGSRGIGAATARWPAQRGYDVAVNYSSNAKAAAGVVDAVKSRRRQGGRDPGRHGRSRPTSSASSTKPPRRSVRSRISCTAPASSATNSRLEEASAADHARGARRRYSWRAALRCAPACAACRRKNGGKGGSIVMLSSMAGDHRRRRRMRVLRRRQRRASMR